MSDQPITPSGLNMRTIYADDLTKKLLPYTTLTAESLDLINQSFGLPHGRNLRLRVGFGITYRAALETDHGDKIEMILCCRDDALIYPLEITINIGLDLVQSEHEADCRYRTVAWVFGAVECKCPYQDYINHVIIVNTEGDLRTAVELVQQAKGGQAAGQKAATA